MKKMIALILTLSLCLSLCACAGSDYRKAMKHYEAREYREAKVIFAQLEDYKDAAEMAKYCDYELAMELMADGAYEEALALLQGLGDFEDAAQLCVSCSYDYAMELMNKGEYEKALALLAPLGEYNDSQDQTMVCVRKVAETHAKNKDLNAAVALVMDYKEYPGAVNIFLDLLCKAFEPYSGYVEDAHGLLNDYVKTTWMNELARVVNKTPAGQSLTLPRVDENDERIIQMREKMRLANEVVDMVKGAYTEENLAAFDGRIAQQIQVLYDSAEKINGFFNALDTYTNCLMIYSSMPYGSMGTSAKKVLDTPTTAMNAMAQAFTALAECYE